MQKQPPSLPRLIVIAVFTLSCFGLLTFLWLSFGGAVPLKPQGYEFHIRFPQATQLANQADVRISGVPIGKVETVTRSGSNTDALDVVINCAGGFGEIGPITLADSGRWWATLETNLKGTYLFIRHALPLLQKGDHPRIINFAGGGAFSPFPNYSAYACSKAAIVRLTECLAGELAPLNVRINAIAPGFVPTPMHQATLAAGEDRAGRMHYQRTHAIMRQGGPSMDHVINCVRMMILPALDELTGKTISSNFDPWETPVFKECLPDIVRSDLYTLRRINIVNLPDGRLRETLSRPWAEAPSR